MPRWRRSDDAAPLPRVPIELTRACRTCCGPRAALTPPRTQVDDHGQRGRRLHLAVRVLHGASASHAIQQTSSPMESMAWVQFLQLIPRDDARADRRESSAPRARPTQRRPSAIRAPDSELSAARARIVTYQASCSKRISPVMDKPEVRRCPWRVARSRTALVLTGLPACRCDIVQLLDDPWRPSRPEGVRWADFRSACAGQRHQPRRLPPRRGADALVLQ